MNIEGTLDSKSTSSKYFLKIFNNQSVKLYNGLIRNYSLVSVVWLVWLTTIGLILPGFKYIVCTCVNTSDPNPNPPTVTPVTNPFLLGNH